MAQIPVTIAERLRLIEGIAAVRGSEVTVRDDLVVTNRLTLKAHRRVTVAELVAIADVARLTGTFGVQLYQQILVSSRINAGQTVRMHDSVKLRSSVRAGLFAHLRDTVHLAPALDVVATYLGSLRDRLRLADKGAHAALGGLLRDSLRLSDSAGLVRGLVARIAEALHLRDSLEPALTLRVELLEGVTLEDVFTSAASLAGYLADRVILSIDVISPSGDATSWAMNTRTGAVTEYLNYDFNSFARSGRGTHLGAASDGLYELVGADDAGDAVIADIVGGLVDFGGTFLSGMQAAYLGVRGGGRFYLRLTSGDGKTHLYGVTARNLQQARIDVGKGLRSRYYTYELVSTGQDFDLTEITFLPVTFSRRV